MMQIPTPAQRWNNKTKQKKNPKLSNDFLRKSQLTPLLISCGSFLAADAAVMCTLLWLNSLKLNLTQRASRCDDFDSGMRRSDNPYGVFLLFCENILSGWEKFLAARMPPKLKLNKKQLHMSGMLPQLKTPWRL